MRIFLEPRDESARSRYRPVKIVDAEEQEQSVARCPVGGTHQRRMILDSPLVEAEQHRSIRVEELTEVAMPRARRALAEEGLVPPEAPRHVPHPDDGPRTLHAIELTAKLTAG